MGVSEDMSLIDGEVVTREDDDEFGYGPLSDMPKVAGNEPCPMLDRVSKYQESMAKRLTERVVSDFEDKIAVGKFEHIAWDDKQHDFSYGGFRDTTDPIRDMAIGHLDSFGIDVERVAVKNGWWIFNTTRKGWKFTVRRGPM